MVVNRSLLRLPRGFTFIPGEPLFDAEVGLFYGFPTKLIKQF